MSPVLANSIINTINGFTSVSLTLDALSELFQCSMCEKKKVLWVVFDIAPQVSKNRFYGNVQTTFQN